MGTTASPPKNRPGGRSARVQAAVFAATLGELRASGYAGMSIGAVAARAGVHETSIYRRWKTKATLVTDALLTLAGEAVPTPDTGALRTDLAALLRQVVAFVRSPEGAAGVQLAVSAGDDTEAAGIRRAYWEDRLGRADGIVRRGVERGELPPETDPRLLIETLVGLAYVRTFLTGGSLDDATVEGVVTLLLEGAAQ